LQQLGEALRRRTRDFVAADHRDVGKEIGARLQCAGRGHRKRVEPLRRRRALRECRLQEARAQ
jgi:hypothetical protein